MTQEIIRPETAAVSPRPRSSTYGAQSYPVSLLVYYPSGEGLQRGSVVLRIYEKLYSDYYTIRKDAQHSELEDVVGSAITSILRTAPNKPVKLLVKAVNRGEFQHLREFATELIRSQNREVRKGDGDEVSRLTHIAEYAKDAVEWTDSVHTRHVYAATLHANDVNYTTILSATRRSIIYKQIQSSFEEPTAATIRSLRDSLIVNADRIDVPIWTNVTQVNGILKRAKGVRLSKEAAGAATEMLSYNASRNIVFQFNALHNPHLARFAMHLSQEKAMKALTDDLSASVPEVRRQ